jgi:PsbP-like protein
MKRNIVLLLLVLVAVTFASGCTFDTGNQVYNSNNVTFNYPSGWDKLSTDQVSIGTADAAPVIAAVADGDSIQNNVYKTLVVVQKTPTDLALSTVVSETKTSLTAQGVEIVSERNLTVSGVPATEIVYTITVSGESKKERMVILVKDNVAYSIVCSTTVADYSSQQSNFDMIINSFQIK